MVLIFYLHQIKNIFYWKLEIINELDLKVFRNLEINIE